MEPKLIGYDETPIDVTAVNTMEHIMVNGDPCRSDPVISPIHEVIDISTPSAKPVDQRLQSSPKGWLSETIQNHGCDNDSLRTDCSNRGAARSRLYELYAENCWKPPPFECCKEEGLDHLKLFAFKVTLEIEEAPDVICMFIGESKSKKKDGAESAAEGAFWYLQKEGCLPKGN